jgi:hypothetical protein
MSLPSRFYKDLRNQLRTRGWDAYEWIIEQRVSEKTKECVDLGGHLTSSKARKTRPVLIEVELKREDPVSNVLKVWTYALRGGYPFGFVFIQGFSRVYRSKH